VPNSPKRDAVHGLSLRGVQPMQYIEADKAMEIAYALLHKQLTAHMTNPVANRAATQCGLGGATGLL